MIMNAYAHKKGSHSGMMPNKVCLLNVSTPVDMKKYSEKNSPIKPKSQNNRSFLCFLISTVTTAKTAYTPAKIKSFEITGMRAIIIATMKIYRSIFFIHLLYIKYDTLRQKLDIVQIMYYIKFSSILSSNKKQYTLIQI